MRFGYGGSVVNRAGIDDDDFVDAARERSQTIVQKSLLVPNDEAGADTNE